MAHDYLLKIMSNSPLVDQVDIEFEVSTAWSYARMMHSEKIKEDKIDSEQKRKEIREMLNAPNTFVERECQHFDDVEEWQPDWSQAPDWANWWSVDENGTANFSGKKPHIEGHQWVYYSAAGEKPCHIEAPLFHYQGNWKESLRKRPEALFEVDWSQAPDDATAWEYLGHESARWHTTTKGMFRSADLFGYSGIYMFLVERPNDL